LETARRVTLDAPDTSLLLLKPLAIAAGGVPHGLSGNNGGEQFVNTTTDQNYIAILQWIVDATQANQGARVSKTTAYPTPFRFTTNIVYFLTTEANQVDVRIYTYNGTEVQHYTGTTNIGANQVEWDGRANDLEPLATGVYFYSVKARFDDGTFIKTGRLVYTP
jgi:flagellar hook assembly protein FlgD